MHEACIMPQPRFSPSCVREQQPDLAAGNEEVAREALAPLSGQFRGERRYARFYAPIEPQLPATSAPCAWHGPRLAVW